MFGLKKKKGLPLSLANRKTLFDILSKEKKKDKNILQNINVDIRNLKLF